MGVLQSIVGRSLLAEFLSEAFATFVLTIVAGITYGLGGSIGAVGVGLAVVFLHQSEKAHMNPVVSIAVALSDIDFGWVNLALRILAQILGAILGGLLAVDGWRETDLDFSVAGGRTETRFLTFEAIFTAVLVVVFLRTRGTSVLAPVVHGFVYLVAILASLFMLTAGNALLNPALALGLVIGSSSANAATREGDIWKFIVGPFIGALLGVVYYQLTNALDDEPETDDETTIRAEETVIRTTVYENEPVAQPVQPTQVELQPPRGSYQ